MVKLDDKYGTYEVPGRMVLTRFADLLLEGGRYGIPDCFHIKRWQIGPTSRVATVISCSSF